MFCTLEKYNPPRPTRIFSFSLSLSLFPICVLYSSQIYLRARLSKKKAHEINVLSYPIQQESRATEPPPSPPPSSTTHVRPLLLQEAREQILRLLEGLGVAAGGLGAEGDGADGGALEVFRGDEVGVLGARELVEDGADEAAGVLGVAAHAGHDHGHVDVALALAPAVVVGRHADDLEGHLGLARELGLGEQRHADDGTAPGAVHVGLGARRELGALCEDNSLRVSGTKRWRKEQATLAG